MRRAREARIHHLDHQAEELRLLPGAMQRLMGIGWAKVANPELDAVLDQLNDQLAVG